MYKLSSSVVIIQEDIYFEYEYIIHILKTIIILIALNIFRVPLSSLSSPWFQLPSIEQATLKSQLNVRSYLLSVLVCLHRRTHFMVLCARWEHRESAAHFQGIICYLRRQHMSA